VNPCIRSTAWLLKADLERLRGEGDSEDASHVRACARCRELAHRVLDRCAQLENALGSFPAPVDVDAILARARLVRIKGESASASPRHGSRDRSADSRSPWRRWLALAAAAAIAGLLIMRSPTPPLPIGLSGPVVNEAPLVEVFAGQEVAVMATDNPDITVLWFF